MDPALAFVRYERNKRRELATVAAQMKSAIAHSGQQNIQIQAMHKLLVQQKQVQAAQTRQMHQILNTLNAHIAECRAANVSIQKKMRHFRVICYSSFIFEKITALEDCSAADVPASDQIGDACSVARPGIGGRRAPIATASARANATVQTAATTQAPTRPAKAKIPIVKRRKNAAVGSGGCVTAKNSEMGKRKSSAAAGSTADQKAIRLKKSKPEDLIISPSPQPQSFEVCLNIYI